MQRLASASQDEEVNNMHMVKVSYGYVDEPDMALTETIGTYESLDEACEAAEDKFGAIMRDLRGDANACFGEIEGSQYDYYDAVGDHTVELGRVFAGMDYYCKVAVVEI